MSVLIRDIEKKFGHVRALDRLELQIGSGELFGLIGPDGAGKTTLFRIMASLLVPDTGTCTVSGFDTVRQYKEVRKRIGYMPGRFSLYMDLTVEENLAFYARVFGTSVSENYDLIKGVYHQLEPFGNRPAGKLSGGMKQKLALSCALIHRPEVLILDEPTTGVDAVSRKEFWDVLKSIQQEGITIVVSTPYMDEAGLCDRVGLIQKGRLLEVTKPDLKNDPAAPSVYSLSSESGAYPYLDRVRSLDGCAGAWLFGSELHVTLRTSGDEKQILKEIMAWDDPTLVWKAIPPGVEDLFMNLMMQSEPHDQDTHHE